MKRILTTFAAALIALAAAAQPGVLFGAGNGEIPPDVFYLMPAFGQGTVYFNGAMPAQGLLNICAVDNTLRFMDDSGQELSAADVSNVIRVVIGEVTFIRDNGFFYRMYPVTSDCGIALKREVRIQTDGKQGAYGTVSLTSAINDYSTIYGVEGASYNLKKDRKYPHTVSEILFLYSGNDVIGFSKKNLRKLFPQKKNEIDRYFKSGNSLPKTLDDALTLLQGWAQ